MDARATSIEQYIAQRPPAVRRLLRAMRAAVRKAAPDAEEVISYGMPGYRLEGMLVYFAAFTRHIGFFPGAQAIVQFERELKPYKTSKGTVQLPFERDLPLALIGKIVRSRVKANLEKARLKRRRR